MKNYLIFTIVGVLLSLLLVFVLVIPSYKDFQALDQKVAEKQRVLESQREYFEQLQNINDRLEGTEESFEKIDSAIPEGRDLANLMNYFQKSASRSGVIISSVSPALVGSTASKKVHASQINLVLAGQYPDFKQFLSIIEKSARLIEIENISFSSPEEGNPFKFNISTKVRYR